MAATGADDGMDGSPLSWLIFPFGSIGRRRVGVSPLLRPFIVGGQFYSPLFHLSSASTVSLASFWVYVTLCSWNNSYHSDCTVHYGIEGPKLDVMP